MLELAPVDVETARTAREAPGGFLWWYLDAVDERGDGCVVIWSYGLPFLPGYASDERRGDAPPAADRPSLNVAIYRGGDLDCYLLREYRPDRVQWEEGEGRWSFGESTFTTERSSGERRVRAAIDAPIPGGGERLRGTVDVRGAAPDRGPMRGEDDEPVEIDHRWEPRLVGGDVEAELRAGSAETYRFSGRGYHDMNCGSTPFHQLGIDRWIWGRIPGDEGERIFYLLDPEDDESPRSVLFDFDPGGHWRRHDDLEFALSGRRREVAGLKWWRELELHGKQGPAWSPLSITFDEVVDRGPFYMRFITRTSGDDDRRGMAELIRPPRIDLARHRPLVQMAIDRPRKGNSAWLPLFSGPRRGRWRRLLSFNIGWDRA